YEKSLSLYRDGGVERSVLNLLTSLADTTWALGDLDAALAVCKESVALMRVSAMTPKLSLGACLSNLAGVHTERGELDDALAAAHAADGCSGRSRCSIRGRESRRAARGEETRTCVPA